LHIHVYCAEGEAKFWIEPSIELVYAYGISDNKLKELTGIIENHKKEIKDAWNKHFGS
jgi:hypothetical protein